MPTIYKSIDFLTEICIKCGTVWAMPIDYINQRRKDHKNFYCPNGHSQYYPQKSDVEKLEEQVAHCQSDIEFWKDGYDAKNNRLQTTERSRRAYKGQVTKLKKILMPANGNGNDDDKQKNSSGS